MSMPLRRSPWLAGLLLLALAAALVAPVAWHLGLRRWPIHLGLLAILLLLFGTAERLWQSVAGSWYRRSLARMRAAARPFRVLPGGKGRRKGNGHDHDLDQGHDDGPRWVM
jgi:hypothetical protein